MKNLPDYWMRLCMGKNGNDDTVAMFTSAEAKLKLLQTEVRLAVWKLLSAHGGHPAKRFVRHSGAQL